MNPSLRCWYQNGFRLHSQEWGGFGEKTWDGVNLMSQSGNPDPAGGLLSPRPSSPLVSSPSYFLIIGPFKHALVASYIGRGSDSLVYVPS